MPQIRNQNVIVDDFFDMLHPNMMDFTFENIKKFINTPFLLRSKQAKMSNSWGNKPMLVLKGIVCHLID